MLFLLDMRLPDQSCPCLYPFHCGYWCWSHYRGLLVLGREKGSTGWEVPNSESPCGILFLSMSRYWRNQSHFQGGGAVLFAACLGGWYLLFSLLLEAVDFPLRLPVGDLSSHVPGLSQLKKRSDWQFYLIHPVAKLRVRTRRSKWDARDGDLVKDQCQIMQRCLGCYSFDFFTQFPFSWYIGAIFLLFYSTRSNPDIKWKPCWFFAKPHNGSVEWSHTI